MSEIEQFWKKIQIELSVKNCKLFEAVRPSSCNLAKINLNPKNVHGANKFYFLRVHQSCYPVRFLYLFLFFFFAYPAHSVEG